MTGQTPQNAAQPDTAANTTHRGRIYAAFWRRDEYLAGAASQGDKGLCCGHGRLSITGQLKLIGPLGGGRAKQDNVFLCVALTSLCGMRPAATIRNVIPTEDVTL